MTLTMMKMMIMTIRMMMLRQERGYKRIWITRGDKINKERTRQRVRREW